MPDVYNTAAALSDLYGTKIDEGMLLKFTDKSPYGAIQVARDITAMVPPGSNKVQVAVLPAVTMTAHTDGTPKNYKQVSTSNVSLTIDTEKSDPFAITYKADALMGPDIFMGYGEQLVSNAMENLDTSLAGLYTAVGATVTGTTGANITEANIRSAKQTLDEANAPTNGRFLLMNPQQANTLSGIARLSEAQTIGSGGAIQSGMVGRVLGFDVFVSNNIVETTDGFAHCLAGVYNQPLPQNNSLVWAAGRLGLRVANNNSRFFAPAGLLLTFGLDQKASAEVIAAHQFYGVAAWRTEWLIDIKVAN